jgi:AcrR family transcriptional regulator
MPPPSTTQASTGSAALGARARSKLDKRQRIAAASRNVFVDKGYEAATTREIAERAGVSIGTVFVYAQDKRELLLMVVNDELDALSRQGEAIIDAPGSFVDRLLAYFRLRYRYWSREPRLSRAVVLQTPDFLAPSEHDAREAHRFYTRRLDMSAQIRRLARQAQAAGEIAHDVPAERIAALLVSVYLLEVRRWLHGPDPRLRSGIAKLRGTVALVMRGIAAR